MKGHVVELARYNAWANRRLYEAAAALPEEDYRADRGVFFRSLHGTLNHVLVADRVWMQRFTGEGEAPDRLDAILYDDLAALTLARQAEDARIIDYALRLTPEQLAAEISYHRVSTLGPVIQQLFPALMHFFNHQTHHRGQAHAILTGTPVQAPELDLLFFQRMQAAV